MTSLFLPAPRRGNNNNNNNISNTGIPSEPAQSSTSTSTTLTNTTTAQTSTTPKPKPPPTRTIPSYTDRCNAALNASKRPTKPLFVPRCTADFGDGGAFPEIHVAQYPRNMGNPHLARRLQRASSKLSHSDNANDITSGTSRKKGPFRPTVGSSAATTRAIVPLSTAPDGSRDYTTVLTANSSSSSTNKTLYAKHNNLKPHTPTPSSISLPTQTELTTTANRTATALSSLLSSQTALSNPSGSALLHAETSRDQSSKTQFLSYAPDPNAPGYNAKSAPQRIIRIVPKQLDPMMPPKHKHRKAPRGPEEDAPAPVLHAPAAKLTKEEREKWNVPACISNWKNTRGYTIPLDKRLAADGRGCREDGGTVNSNFANLSESLYLAEREAREEVRVRADVKRRQAEMVREKREKELRELAMRARIDRGGGGGGLEGRLQERRVEPVVGDGGADVSAAAAAAAAGKAALPHIVPDSDDDGSSGDDQDRGDDNRDYPRGGNHDRPPSRRQSGENDDSNNNNNNNDRIGFEEREKIREERRKERLRELRMERQKPGNDNDDNAEDGDNGGVMIKKARLDGDRDVSEKIALGVHKGGGALGGGVDSRLYNQNAGLDSGFGAEDEYNAYTKPMFDKVSSSSIYRPSRNEATMDGDEQYDKLTSKSAGITAKFQPDKGFKGAEGGGAGVGGGAARSAPVQFEKGGAVAK